MNCIDSVRYMGQSLPISVFRTSFAFWRIKEHDGELRLFVPKFLPENVMNITVREQVRLWLRSQAHNKILQSVRKYSLIFGFTYGKIRIKDTVSRWGSCSREGNLNFNWRIIMAPSEVIDYLVIHETAHLQELNHSGAFWGIVKKRCPEYRSSIAWLKSFGKELICW